MKRLEIGRAETSPPQPWSSRSRVALGALLLGSILSVYWIALDAPFVFDDRPAILENATIRHLWGSWQPPENGSSAVGRPLVNVSFALNYAFSGYAVRGYHAVNVALHCAVALLLWGTLRRTLWHRLTNAAELFSFISALWWAVHPLQTESVTCVVQRTEVMGALFYLLTFYAYVRSTQSERHARQWEAVAVSASFVGVFAKEIVATAPLLIFLHDRTFVSGSFVAAWRKRKRLLGLLAATWIPLAILVGAGGGRTGTVGFGLGISPWEYLLTQCEAITRYLRLCVWPSPLVIDYGVPVVRGLVQVFSQGIALLGMLAVTIGAVVRYPKLGFIGAVFFVILAPSSSFIPLTTQTIAEHRMYLPLAAVVMICALPTLVSPRLASIAFGAIVAVLLGIGTVARNREYRDEMVLWRQTIAAVPENPRAYSSYGNSLVREKKWGEAIEQYQRALALRPDFADAHNNLGLALLELGQIAPAVPHLQAAVRLKPDDPDINYNLGNAYVSIGDGRNAVPFLRKAAELRPGFLRAEIMLGVALLGANQAREAADAFRRAAAIEPGNVEALAGWGNALLALGEPQAAAEKYETALRFEPQLADLHYNLANTLLHLKRPVDAETEYVAALKIDPTSPAYHHNLGLALLQLSRPREAVGHFEQALSAMPSSALVHHSLSRALAEIGEGQRAVQEAELARELDPSNSELRAWVSQLRQSLSH